ncbi:MAG: helix-turn-helix domain-containing protein [Imperialibacter sp.]
MSGDTHQNNPGCGLVSSPATSGLKTHTRGDVFSFQAAEALNSALYGSFFCFSLGKAYFYIEKSSMMHFMEIHKIVKDRREMMQVTQETLAEISGVGLRTIKQFETGKGNPTLQTLQKLADVLGMEICLQVKNTLDSK